MKKIRPYKFSLPATIGGLLLLLANLLPAQNLIQGTVFNDLNGDCAQFIPSGEIGMQGWTVKAEPGPRFATTNINGVYRFNVPAGNYTVSLQLPNGLWQQLCPAPPGTYAVNFSGPPDTSYANDFPVEAGAFCPLMQVGLGTPAVEACEKVVHTVSFANNGTATAVNAYIEIEFDHDAFPLSSTFAWSGVVGKTFTFNLGNVGPGQSGTFYITDSISCNAAANSSICVDAHIYPDSFCILPNPAWDGSNITVEARCDTGTATPGFVIRNTGAAMQGSSQYIFYENSFKQFPNTFQLGAGDSLALQYPTFGSTIRLEAAQRPGHPGISRPSATVEACGVPGLYDFLNQLPEDDWDPFREIDCRQVGVSGNVVKTCHPEGRTGLQPNELNIEDSVMEYHIAFQNQTGDTIQSVTIRDSIDANLNIETLELGASSHPYTFRIAGARTLVWQMENITLLPSDSGFAVSQGFVKFKIRHVDGLQEFDSFSNSAEIEFDGGLFQQTTNSVFNVIANEFTVEADAVLQDRPGVKVWPNPARETVHFKVENVEIDGGLRLRLFDLLGNEIRNAAFETAEFSIDGNDIPAGLYLYRVEMGGRKIGAGKIKVER